MNWCPDQGQDQAMRIDPFRYDENDIGQAASAEVRVLSLAGLPAHWYARAYRWLLDLIVHAYRDGSGGARRSTKDTHSQDGPRVCLSAVYRLI
jgi:hypothetical protein